MSLITRTFKYPVLLLLITIAFSWKLVLPDQYTWLEASDIAFQLIPWLQVQAAQWHTGHFPLWDTHLWAGQPLVGEVQTGTLNPLNWLLFSLPLKNGFIQMQALHWYWVLIHYLGVLFGYCLCRDLALSHTASVLAGCAFGLGGFVGSMAWPQLTMSALLLPLILMFFLRALREENAVSNAAASGALLGASYLTGHHNVPTFFALVMAGLWIYYFVTLRKFFRWTAIAPVAAFLVCFALIAAAQILPAVELGRLSLRWVNASNPVTWNERVPYSVHQSFSLYPTAILGIVIPGFQRDSEVFIGLVAFTLALLGAVASWHDRVVRVLAAVALGGLVFSLGGYSLFHGILYAFVPNLDKARSPSMAEAIFHLGIIALAAFGVESFRSSTVNEWVRQLATRLLGLTSFFLFASLIVLNTLRPEQSEEYKVLAMAAIVAIILAGILVSWHSAGLSDRAAGTLLILLLLFELNGVSNYGFRQIGTATNLRKLHENRDLAEFVTQNPTLARVDVDRNEIPYNFGDWFGVDELGGFLPATLKAIAETQGDLRYRSLLAVNYFIGRNPTRADQTIAFDGKSGLKVFVNPNAFPRARMVHVAVSESDEAGVISATLNPNTDLHRTVVLQEPSPGLDSCEGGSVQVQRYRPTSVVLRANSPCRAMVIFADAWFPGWKAFVDGRPARIYPAYNVIRGVVVDAGDHDVTMIYRPASVFTGMILAFVGIVLCVGLQFRHSNEKREARN